MRNQSKFTFLFVGLGLLFVPACIEFEELPNEPIINEISFDKAVTTLYIRFTDGDGNFGLEPDQLSPPFQVLNLDSTANFFHYNMHVDMFYRENGEWIPVTFAPGSIGLKFRIPDLTPQGQSKQLRVLISWDLAFENEGILQLNPGIDTIMYRAVLVDRDLNISEPAETAPIALEE
jgi:hypothetical protein